MYLYIKALHIIFIVTWFSGMFYIPRLFIYNTEAYEKSEPAKTILQQQLQRQHDAARMRIPMMVSRRMHRNFHSIVSLS